MGVAHLSIMLYARFFRRDEGGCELANEYSLADLPVKKKQIAFV